MKTALLPHLIAIVMTFLITTTAGAAPDAELWQRWTTHNSASGQIIDHSAWNRFLSRHVHSNPDGINRVSYADVSKQDKSLLDAYIKQLEAVRISEYSRPVQAAYWINLYNALTVQVILDNFPLDSIRDISSGFFSSGPWGLKLAKIEGEALTLDNIEHRILRPIWQDPRIHYAVNCASIGCPNLMASAFTADNIDQLLEAGARDFINHHRGARVVNGELEVSSIYDWFEDDFGGNDSAVIAHLKHYADAELAESLESITQISDDSYDWNLNIQ